MFNLQTIPHDYVMNSTVLSKKCSTILKNKEIRFCGIINNMGRQVVGAYQEGITPLVDSEEHKMCMEYSLGMFITTDLDEALGPTEYIISRRKKVTMISIPVSNHLILISVESNANEKEIIQEAISLFKDDL